MITSRGFQANLFGIKAKAHGRSCCFYRMPRCLFPAYKPSYRYGSGNVGEEACNHPVRKGPRFLDIQLFTVQFDADIFTIRSNHIWNDRFVKLREVPVARISRSIPMFLSPFILQGIVHYGQIYHRLLGPIAFI
ncbi:hypothetical protein D3C81_1801890 [compost metagenome]